MKQHTLYRKVSMRQRLGKLQFGFILFFILFMIPRNTISASDMGYRINQYQMDITVMEDGKIHVKELIQVNFKEYRHGIIRQIPIKQKNKIESENGNKTYVYDVKISGLSVESDPFTQEKEDGYLKLKLGSADKSIMGPKTYSISYTMDIGDDRIPEYDMFYFDIIGPDWDTYIDAVDFKITFEKPVDLKQMKFYSGTIGSTDSDITEYLIEGNKISGYTTKMLAPGEALTAYVQLPSDYFVGAAKYSTFPMMAGIVVLSILLITAALYWKRKKAKKKIVSTVEFYPPDGISSAEVGYIIDGKADQKDIMSLIIWFAHEGYITISGEGKEMEFTKKKNLREDAASYMEAFFNGLFHNGDVVKMVDLKDDFYESYQAALSCLSSYFQGGRSLDNSRTTIRVNILTLLITITGALTLVFCGGTIDTVLLIVAVLSSSLLGCAGFLIQYFWRQRIFSGIGKLTAAYLITGILYLICVVWFLQRNTFFIFSIPLAVFALTFLGVMFSSGIYEYTDYKAQTAGKLLGLRNFIKTAELDRIKMLAEKDPEYFYGILPYAYVFGLTDLWIKQFESIPVPPPVWYGGNYGTSFTTYHMVHVLNAGCTQTIQQINEAAASKIASSSGSETSGGGGFSGGGFGGGGGSSW